MHRSDIFKSEYLSESKSNNLWYIIIAVVVIIVVYCWFNKDLSEGFENAKNQFFNSQTTVLSGTDTLQNGTAIKYESNNELYIQVYANLLLLDQDIYNQDQFSTKHSYRVYLGNGKANVFIGELSFSSDKTYKLRGKTNISSNMYRYITVNVSDGVKEKQVLYGKFSN